jgi:hypothetical protein
VTASLIVGGQQESPCQDSAMSGRDYEFEDLYLGALLGWAENDVTCGTPHLVDG